MSRPARSGKTGRYPAVVTKLADRGSFQTMGIVTDVESFMRELCGALELWRKPSGPC
ncbi:MAG: hypothetical protein QME79_11425 [Bacillota bacterium]|nr:hypothetical protein [Bacillota bacterium]